MHDTNTPRAGTPKWIRDLVPHSGHRILRIRLSYPLFERKASIAGETKQEQTKNKKNSTLRSASSWPDVSRPARHPHAQVVPRWGRTRATLCLPGPGRACPWLTLIWLALFRNRVCFIRNSVRQCPGCAFVCVCARNIR